MSVPSVPSADQRWRILLHRVDQDLCSSERQTECQEGNQWTLGSPWTRGPSGVTSTLSLLNWWAATQETQEPQTHHPTPFSLERTKCLQKRSLAKSAFNWCSQRSSCFPHISGPQEGRPWVLAAGDSRNMCGCWTLGNPCFNPRALGATDQGWVYWLKNPELRNQWEGRCGPTFSACIAHKPQLGQRIIRHLKSSSLL